MCLPSSRRSKYLQLAVLITGYLVSGVAEEHVGRVKNPFSPKGLSSNQVALIFLDLLPSCAETGADKRAGHAGRHVRATKCAWLAQTVQNLALANLRQLACRHAALSWCLNPAQRLQQTAERVSVGHGLAGQACGCGALTKATSFLAPVADQKPCAAVNRRQRPLLSHQQAPVQDHHPSRQVPTRGVLAWRPRHHRPGDRAGQGDGAFCDSHVSKTAVTLSCLLPARAPT